MIYLPHIVRRIILDLIFVPQVTIGGPSEIRGSTHYNAFSGNGLFAVWQLLSSSQARTEGLATLYRGCQSTVTAVSISNFVYFYSFHGLKVERSFILQEKSLNGFSKKFWFCGRGKWHLNLALYVDQIFNIQRLTRAFLEFHSLKPFTWGIKNRIFTCMCTEVHWGFWAAVSSKGSAFRLLRGWVFARFSSGIIYQIIQVETPKKMDKLPKEKVFKSRDPFLILPRLHKCPSDQSTVGGQSETENGWSRPSCT